MKKRYCLLLLLILVLGVSKVYALSENELNNTFTNRIKSIRKTPNTDVSNRNGKIYYVANNGNDSNDGSKDHPWKTIEKVNNAFDNKVIKNGDTVLFNRGDSFRGNINVKSYDILLGSYGNENKPKPEILVSSVNGATKGEWHEVENNIWEYTIDGNIPFNEDVGTIWFFDNNNVKYGIKKTTNADTNEDNINLSSILKKDLEIYQLNHSSARNKNAKNLYVYSESNPKDRFNDIEFALSVNGIGFSKYSDLVVDNLTIKYAGNHGIGGGTVANLKVTNCELGYIGGAVQYYREEAPYDSVRFGNAVEIYGSVTDVDNYEVKDGFVADNNYIYQVYDAGLTFQITTDNSSIIEKVDFKNNVIEYCNYNIEYWNTSKSDDIEVQKNTYINKFNIHDNLMRYSGYGLSETRPDKGRSAFLKTWRHRLEYDNYVKGEFNIYNNVFMYSKDNMFIISATNEESLPKFYNNELYNSTSGYFGEYFVVKDWNKTVLYPYAKSILNGKFKNNTFNYTDGFTNDTIIQDGWKLNLDTGVLEITKDGRMDDYNLDSMPLWYQYKNHISKIIIGEKVTHIGEYSFYDLPYVKELVINAKELDNLSKSDTNTGSNYSFYKTASMYGMDVEFGKDVTVIPSFLFWPSSPNDAPTVNNITFKGNKIKEIKDHSLPNLKVSTLIIPQGVEKIDTLSLAYSNKVKEIILPDSVKTLGAWVFCGDTNLEKIILSKNITNIRENNFINTKSLKELIIPGTITFTSNMNNMFSLESNTTVYGNESVKNFVDSYSSSTNTSNIKYKNLNDYKININSNIDIVSLNTATYGDDYSFKIDLDDNTIIDNIVIKDINNNTLEYTFDNGVYKINNVQKDINISIDTTSLIILDGNNEIYVKAKDDYFIIKCNGSLNKFKYLEIDNSRVDNKYYSLESGSTIIKLHSNYLDTLDNGKHSMKLVYENNKFVTADFIVKRKESEETIANNKGKTNPNTADNIVTHITLLTISLLGLVLVSEKLKNKKSTQN